MVTSFEGCIKKLPFQFHVIPTLRELTSGLNTSKYERKMEALSGGYVTTVSISCYVYIKETDELP